MWGIKGCPANDTVPSIIAGKYTPNYKVFYGVKRQPNNTLIHYIESVEYWDKVKFDNNIDGYISGLLIYNGMRYTTSFGNMDKMYNNASFAIEQVLENETLLNPQAVITYVDKNGLAYSYQNYILTQVIDLNTKESLEINSVEAPQILKSTDYLTTFPNSEEFQSPHR